MSSSRYSSLFEDVLNPDNVIKSSEFSAEQSVALDAPFSESCLIFAGAGSGKTKVLVERVSNLIKRGVNPKSICVLSYTKNSADEIHKRIRAKAPNSKGLFTGTLHSLVLKHMLRKSSFTFEISPPDAIINFVSEFKQFMPDSYADFSDSELLTLINKKREQKEIDESVIGNYAHQFSIELAENGLYDFTSLLEDGLTKLTPSFDYIFVDEFQDISELQLSVIRKLGNKNCKFWFIGDPCQSIYVFRGASSSIMTSLKESMKPYYLNTNFRSDINIVSKSNKFLNSFDFFEKNDKIASSSKEGEVNVFSYASPEDEFNAVKAWATSQSDYVILGRTQASIAPYLDAGIMAKTIHESKGLEWSSVWVIGCNQGSFPHVLSSLEEEACIFYVAMSRAKSILNISYYKKISIFIEKLQA